MDSLNSHKLQKGKRKTNTILKHRHIRMIANLWRYIEFCIVLVMVSRLSIQIPLAVENSSEYFRGFSGFKASPAFVFFLGNVIIATIFAQSGHFSANSSSKDNPEHDLYREFLQSSFINYNYKNNKTQADKIDHPQKQSIGGPEDIKIIQNIGRDGVKCREKISMKTRNSIKGRRIDGGLVQYIEKQSLKTNTETEDILKDQKIDGGKITRTDTSLVAVKDYRRCPSEILKHVQIEKPRSVLHRCESENNKGSNEGAGSQRVAWTSYPEDGMSNEEFRRTIEAFIARQQRLRRQEQC